MNREADRSGMHNAEAGALDAKLGELIALGTRFGIDRRRPRVLRARAAHVHFGGQSVV